jgi:hypothetical protein
MNEQIRKLMLESDCISLNISNKMERFAELIIRECINATGNCAGTGDMIKEHFGIEE